MEVCVLDGLGTILDCGCRAAVGFGNRIWGNQTVMTYLKTGVFNYWVPAGSPVHWEVSPRLWHCAVCAWAALPLQHG